MILLVEMLTILCVAIFATGQLTIYAQARRFEHEREEWQAERKDLLDRIQAPSFAEYTNKVIKEKKAEQPQEEEKPIEFVS